MAQEARRRRYWLGMGRATTSNSHAAVKPLRCRTAAWSASPFAAGCRCSASRSAANPNSCSVWEGGDTNETAGFVTVGRSIGWAARGA